MKVAIDFAHVVKYIIYLLSHNIFGDKMKQPEQYNLICELAKGITGYSFRNGIVEKFHSNGCLTDDQMKQLNKYMVDRIGYVFNLIYEDRWDDLVMLLSFHCTVCRKWDDVDLSVGENELNKIKEQLKDDKTKQLFNNLFFQ